MGLAVIGPALALVLVASPAEAEDLRTDAAVDVPVTLGTGAVWFALYTSPTARVPQTGETAEPPRGLDALAPHRLNPGAARASDLLLFGVGGTTLAASAWQGRGDLADRLLLYSQTVAINGAVTELFKSAVRRPRPYTFGDGRTGDPDEDFSFFSGHTSFVAAFSFTTAHAMAIDLEPGLGGRAALYGGATALTLATAGLRVAAGKHYPTDVLVGAIVGASIGWLVPELHRAGRFDVGATGGSDRVMVRIGGRL